MSKKDTNGQSLMGFQGSKEIAGAASDFLEKIRKREVVIDTSDKPNPLQGIGFEDLLDITHEIDIRVKEIHQKFEEEIMDTVTKLLDAPESDFEIVKDEICQILVELSTDQKSQDLVWEIALLVVQKNRVVNHGEEDAGQVIDVDLVEDETHELDIEEEDREKE